MNAPVFFSLQSFPYLLFLVHILFHIFFRIIFSPFHSLRPFLPLREDEKRMDDSWKKFRPENMFVSLLRKHIILFVSFFVPEPVFIQPSGK